MNTTTSLVALLLACAVGAGDAMAKRIQANSPESGKAFSDCAKNDGATWTQSQSDTAGNVTYGCIDKNGHGLVCGGGTAALQNSCDTFRMSPPFPTRDQAMQATGGKATEADEAKSDAP